MAPCPSSSEGKIIDPQNGVGSYEWPTVEGAPAGREAALVDDRVGYADTRAALRLDPSALRGGRDVYQHPSLSDALKEGDALLITSRERERDGS